MSDFDNKFFSSAMCICMERVEEDYESRKQTT